MQICPFCETKDISDDSTFCMKCHQELLDYEWLYFGSKKVKLKVKNILYREIEIDENGKIKAKPLNSNFIFVLKAGDIKLTKSKKSILFFEHNRTQYFLSIRVYKELIKNPDSLNVSLCCFNEGYLLGSNSVQLNKTRTNLIIDRHYFIPTRLIDDLIDEKVTQIPTWYIHYGILSKSQKIRFKNLFLNVEGMLSEILKDSYIVLE